MNQDRTGHDSRLDPFPVGTIVRFDGDGSTGRVLGRHVRHPRMGGENAASSDVDADDVHHLTVCR